MHYSKMCSQATSMILDEQRKAFDLLSRVLVDSQLLHNCFLGCTKCSVWKNVIRVVILGFIYSVIKVGNMKGHGKSRVILGS